jgi:cell division septum initiation protein DivIVA
MAVSLLVCVPTPSWAQELDRLRAERPGVAADSRGGPAVDPTKNVLDLVEAAIRRQDDLRAAAAKLFQAKLEAAEKLDQIRYERAQDAARALADKLESEAKLRSDYDQKLREAESKRIDAIRLVDVNAVSEDRRRTGEQAVALATQVSQSADTVRALVASTKTSTDLSVSQVTQALSQRITTLEQAGYQQAGKQTISDPALVALNAKVDALVNSRTDLAGRDTGRSDVIGWIVGGLGLLIGLGALFMKQRPSAT